MSVCLDSAYGAWISRILTPILIIIQVYIIIKSIKNRRRIFSTNTDDNKDNVKEKNTEQREEKRTNLNTSDATYEKWLNIFSLSSMISFTCCSVFIVLFKTPLICRYVYALPISCYFAAQCTCTMYQICRLQYCFASPAIQSTNFAYPKWIFIILYGIGIILTSYIFISIWFVWQVVDIGSYGCILKQRDWWRMDIFAVIPLTIMWIWDITVLLLYVIKIYQLTNLQRKKNLQKKRCSSSDHYQDNGQRNNDKYAKIDFILKKIVGLTVAYEIKALIAGFIQFGGFQYQSIIANTTLSVDVLLSIIIIYLMIEHNNNAYIKCKNRFNCCTKEHCSCCCCLKCKCIDRDNHDQKNKNGYMNVDISMDHMNINNNELKIVLTSVIAMDSSITDDSDSNKVNHDVTITEI